MGHFHGLPKNSIMEISLLQVTPSLIFHTLVTSFLGPVIRCPPASACCFGLSGLLAGLLKTPSQLSLPHGPHLVLRHTYTSFALTTLGGQADPKVTLSRPCFPSGLPRLELRPVYSGSSVQCPAHHHFSENTCGCCPPRASGKKEYSQQ